MEDFLNESEVGQNILQESRDTKLLSKPARKKLANLLCDFLLEKYNEPPPDDVKAMCTELIEIFPCLRHSPSNIGGIVSSKFHFIAINCIVDIPTHIFFAGSNL